MKGASLCVVKLGSYYHEVQPLDQTKHIQRFALPGKVL